MKEVASYSPLQQLGPKLLAGSWSRSFLRRPGCSSTGTGAAFWLGRHPWRAREMWGAGSPPPCRWCTVGCPSGSCALQGKRSVPRAGCQPPSWRRRKGCSKSCIRKTAVRGNSRIPRTSAPGTQVLHLWRCPSCKSCEYLVFDTHFCAQLINKKQNILALHWHCIFFFWCLFIGKVYVYLWLLI